MIVSRLLNFLASLFLPRLAREVALDLEAHALERQADRLARLYEKVEELQASGHKGLAQQLLDQMTQLSADNPILFRTDLPGLPDFAGEAPPQPAPAAPPTPLPPPPSTNGTGGKRPHPRSPHGPEPQPAAGTVPDGLTPGNT